MLVPIGLRKQIQQAKKINVHNVKIIAKELGVTVDTLHKFKRGLLNPSFETLNKMCNLFQCQVSDLYYFMEDEKNV